MGNLKSLGIGKGLVRGTRAFAALLEPFWLVLVFSASKRGLRVDSVTEFPRMGDLTPE
jgi:hypothetical protein